MALIDTAFLDTKRYGFEWLRLIPSLAGAYEGIVAPGDFLTTAAAAGGMRVDVAPGIALVQGDTGTRNGLYAQVNDAAIANAATLGASHGSLPRLDQIVLRVRDSSDLGDASDVPSIDVVAGVATAGATLDNRNGAAALPANALRLADVLVPAASVAVTAGNVRDRRKRALPGELAWANGTSATVSGISVVTDVPGVSIIVPEYDGPIVVEAGTFNMFNATDNTFMDLQLRDGANAVLAGWVGLTEQRLPTGGTGDQGSGGNLKARRAAPGMSAGAQTIKLRAVTNAGSGTIDNGTLAFIQATGL